MDCAKLNHKINLKLSVDLSDNSRLRRIKELIINIMAARYNLLLLFALCFTIIPAIFYSKDESKGAKEKVLLYYDDQNNDKTTLATISEQKVLLNNKFIKRFHQKYIGRFHVDENKKKVITGKYSFFRKSKKTGSYRLYKKRVTRFTREKTGKLHIEPQFFYPVLRSVPQFPEHAVGVGDSWESHSHISQDHRKFGIPNPRLIEITPRYLYLKNVTYKGIKCALISVRFLINQNNLVRIGRRYRRLWVSKKGLYIARWMGTFTGRYYYSLKDHYIIHFEVHYNHLLFYENGVVQEIIGDDLGNVERKRE
ncbi:MAG: hypothetical protein IEMM0008_0987 [bacterium]|nr:MAG: hypothetical protein IEMM0008_0987 [bacterium]